MSDDLKPHIAEYEHGGPIMLSFYGRMGKLKEAIHIGNRENLLELRGEIDRWLLSHSGVCPCCGHDYKDG